MTMTMTMMMKMMRTRTRMKETKMRRLEVERLLPRRQVWTAAQREDSQATDDGTQEE
jgi:hypothetical protein